MSKNFPICTNHVSENFRKVLHAVILCESFAAATRKKKSSESGNPFVMYIGAYFQLTGEKQHLGNFLTVLCSRGNEIQDGLACIVSNPRFLKIDQVLSP